MKRISCFDRMCGADDCPNCHPENKYEDILMNEDEYQQELEELHATLTMHLDGAHKIIKALNLGDDATPPEVINAITSLQTTAQQWQMLARMLAKDLIGMCEIAMNERSSNDLALFAKLECECTEAPAP